MKIKQILLGWARIKYKETQVSLFTKKSLQKRP